MLDYLEPLKLLLYEVEMESWRRYPDVRPAERTVEMFDTWFKLEPHSMVRDAADVPIEK